MDIMTILTSLIKIFIIIIPGAIFSRKGILNENQCEGISSIVLNLTWPCIVIDSLQMPYSPELLHNSAILICAMIGVLIVAYGVSLLISKFVKAPQHIFYLMTFLMLFANTGFMGIPICNALYGNEGVFYAALMDSLSDMFAFTVGMFLIRKSTGNGEKSSLKELLSPGLVGIIIGIVLFLTDTRLPEALGESIAIIGSATTPLAMLIIGFKLGQMSIKEMLGDMRVYAVTVGRLVLVPLIVFAVVAVAGIEVSLLIKVVVIQAAMPAATCAVIFAEQYKGDAKFMSKGVLLTTLLSVVTIPIFAVLIEMI